jgi:hypothetical protein
MSQVWHDPRFTSTTCFACGATVGDPCVVPGTVFPEQLTEELPHPKRIEKMIAEGILDAEHTGPFPYTDYLASLNGEPT